MKAIILCGLPATGKTFIRNKLREQLKAPYEYSLDDIVEDFCINTRTSFDDIYGKAVSGARSLCDIGLEAAIRNERDIIWDQTNTSRAKRMRILDLIPKDYSIECHYIRMTNREEVMRRIAERTLRRIPMTIFNKMIGDMVEPDIYREPFASVTTYDMDGNVLMFDKPSDEIIDWIKRRASND